MSSIENRVAELEEQVKILMEKLGSATKQTKAKDEKKTEKKAEKKAEKKTENKDGSPKKKRGTTGYLMFAKETRPDAKATLINDGNETPKPTEVVTEIAKRWKALTDEDRDVWNVKAKETNSSTDEDEPTEDA